MRHFEEKEHTKRCIGYARVSSADQKADRQIIALEEIGIKRENIYVDKITGKNFDRPSYKKMINDINTDTVLFVKSIDRLGRNYQDLCDQWRMITKDIGADIVVIDMPILDTRKEKNLLGTFITDLILTLLSYCSANEYNMIRQRQAEGIAAARARGVRMGRPPLALPENFDLVYTDWKNGQITTAYAATLCEMPISTFRYKAIHYNK